MAIQVSPKTTLTDSLGEVTLVWKDLFVNELGRNLLTTSLFRIEADDGGGVNKAELGLLSSSAGTDFGLWATAGGFGGTTLDSSTVNINANGLTITGANGLNTTGGTFVLDGTTGNITTSATITTSGLITTTSDIVVDADNSGRLTSASSITAIIGTIVDDSFNIQKNAPSGNAGNILHLTNTGANDGDVIIALTGKILSGPFTEKTATFGMDFTADTAGGFVINSAGQFFVRTNGSTATNRFAIADDGVITFNNAFAFPNADGTANQVLETDGAGNLSFVAQSGGSFTLPIDATGTETTVSEFNIDNDQIFTGVALNSMFSFVLDNTSATGSLGYLKHDGTGIGLTLIGTNASASGLLLDMDYAGTGVAADFTTTAVTAQVARFICNNKTTGPGVGISTSSAGFTGSGVFGMLDVTVTNGSATGHVARFQQVGTGNGLFIDMNGNGVSLNIDSESTSTSVINLVSATTTGNDILVISPALTSGSGVNVSTSSIAFTGALFTGASTGNNGAVVGDVFTATTSGASSVARCARFVGATTGVNTTITQNTVAGKALFIDQNTNAISLDIDSEATTTSAVNIASVGSGDSISITQAGTGKSIDIDSSATANPAIDIQVDSLASREGLNVSSTTISYSGSLIKAQLIGDNANITGNAILGSTTGASANARCAFFTGGTLKEVVKIQQVGASAATTLLVNQDTNGISIDIDSEAISATVFNLVAANTSGTAMIVNNAGAGGDIVDFQDGGTSVFKALDGGNIGVNLSSFGGGVKVISIANATSLPGSNPTGGGILYVDSGALKYRGSSGTVTTIAVA